MTIHEASARYNIPLKILQEYEGWGLCKEPGKSAGNWQYDQTDIERLSLILTLYESGFSKDEAEYYMRLSLLGDRTSEERIAMLRKKRTGTLDEIHCKQKQLDLLDYLRFEISRASRSHS